MKAIKLKPKKLLKTIFAVILASGQAFAQERKPEKISHAEPLYVDLVRDLGARKGEREINLAAEVQPFDSYQEYGILAEYEFAPVNRLGLEVEADVSFFKATGKHERVTPGSKLDCLRFSAQYSFWVAPKIGTTLAVGYTQILSLRPFGEWPNKPATKAFGFNPFFVAAKKWGRHFHSLLLFNPVFERQMNGASVINWQFNASVHYSIPGTRSLIGIELNEESVAGATTVIARPQLKVSLSDRLAIGLVAALPIKGVGGAGSFCRVIYEP